MTRRLPDRDNRTRAVTAAGVNQVVVAGAGTGKTSLLVERLVNQVLAGAIRMERTVAITFTEKAAAQMEDRIAEALSTIAAATETGGSAPPDEHSEAGRSLRWLVGDPGPGLAPDVVHRRATAALEDLERASIGTIHAFCADLLRRHPMEADLPPEFSVGTVAEQESIFVEEWHRFLDDELGAGPPRPDLWRRTLAAFDEETIQETARALAGKPSAMDLLADGKRALQDPVTVFDEAVRDHTARLGEIAVETQGGRAGKFQTLLREASRLFEVFRERGPAGLREEPAEGPVWEDSVSTPGAHVDAARHPAIKRDVGGALRLLRKLRQIDEERVGSVMEALEPFSRRFRRRVVRSGTLTFDDLLLLARNTLRDHPQVRSREAARIDALFLDEFQDTDPLQYEIIFFLGASDPGRVREPDPYRLPLAPGRLFIVGDAKQSIYRFRGADMAAYQRAVAHVEETGGTREPLRTNFRSPPEMLEPLNRLFEDWIGTGADGDRTVEPEYVPILPPEEDDGAAPDPGGTEPCVEIWSLAAPGRAEDRRQVEAKEIVRRVQDWIDHDGIPLSEIALLFRAMTDIALYSRRFREGGVPFVVDGGKSFAQKQEVQEAVALLRALANPADAVATLAVLRSAVGAAPDAELAAFARERGRFNWRSVKPEWEEPFPNVFRTFALLRDMDRRGRRLAVDRRILLTLTEGRFPVLMAAFYEGAQRMANVKKLADRAAGLARTRGLTLEETIHTVETEILDEADEGESPLADEGLEAVRLLTIHRAKGLQFRRVIVPDIGRMRGKENSVTLAAVHRGSAPDRLGVRVGDRANTAMIQTAVEDDRHRDAEQKRLLYVATTRARERLVLVNHDTGSRPWLEALGRWGYKATRSGNDRLFPEEDRLAEDRVLHRLLEPGPALVDRSPSHEVEPGHHLSFLAAIRQASASRPPRFRTPTDGHARDRETVPEGEVAPGKPRDRDLARAAGKAVHRLLELWDLETTDTLIEPLAEVTAAAAREFGRTPGEVEHATRVIVEGFLGSPLPRRLADAEILGREVPILYRDPSGTTVHGYADLIYRHDGLVHVADFKTDSQTGPARAETYRGQLNDYADATRIALALDERPTAEVWFVRTGERVPLPAAEPTTP